MHRATSGRQHGGYGTVPDEERPEIVHEPMANADLGDHEVERAALMGKISPTSKESGIDVEGGHTHKNICTGALMNVWHSVLLLKPCPRELWIVYLLNILASFAYFATSYVLVLLLSREYQFTDEEAGWAYGLQGMLISIYGILIGVIIDILGVKISLISGSILEFVGRVMLAFMSDKAAMIISVMILMPLGMSLTSPVMTIGIRRYTTDVNRSIAFSLFYVVMNIAAFIASTSVDGVRFLVKDGVDVFGVTLSSFRFLVFISSLANFSILVISTFFIREIDVSNNGEAASFKPKRESPLRSMKIIGKSKRFWKFMIFILLLIGVRNIFRHLDATFPKYMERDLGKNAPWGTIVSINPIIIIFFVPIVSVATKDFKIFNVIQVGTFFSGISPFCLAFGASYEAAVIFVIVLSIGEAIWSPRLFEYTVMIAEKGHEGMYSALGSAPMFLTKLVVGGFSGYLLDEYCPATGPRMCHMMWIIIGITTLSSSILITVFKPWICPTDDEISEATALSSDHNTEDTPIHVPKAGPKAVPKTSLSSDTHSIN